MQNMPKEELMEKEAALAAEVERLLPDFVKSCRDNAGVAAWFAHSLLFIQILAGNIILRHLMRANFPLVSVPGVFHALHRPRL